MAQVEDRPLLSTGEVILIETQQHWMAAIRFALRPILLALLGVGLLILNEILDVRRRQFLSFINDLI